MPVPIKPRLPVSEGDLANLRSSGLTDETIRNNLLKTENNALVFPYRNLKGEVNCFARRRPHNGKPAKYLQPRGTPMRAYLPKESLSLIQDLTQPVFITEGEKKALALSQCGLAAIGIGGIWCGCKKQSCELIDDLREINWKGRDVYIVFDYDEKSTTRMHAMMAVRRLAKALRSVGAKEVYNVELPPGMEAAE